MSVSLIDSAAFTLHNPYYLKVTDMCSNGVDISYNGTPPGVIKLWADFSNNNPQNIPTGQFIIDGSNITIDGQGLELDISGNNFGNFTGLIKSIKNQNSKNINIKNINLKLENDVSLNHYAGWVCNGNIPLGCDISFNNCQVNSYSTTQDLNISSTGLYTYNGGICGGNNSYNHLSFDNCKVSSIKNIDISQNTDPYHYISTDISFTVGDSSFNNFKLLYSTNATPPPPFETDFIGAEIDNENIYTLHMNMDFINKINDGSGNIYTIGNNKIIIPHINYQPENEVPLFDFTNCYFKMDNSNNSGTPIFNNTTDHVIITSQVWDTLSDSLILNVIDSSNVIIPNHIGIGCKYHITYFQNNHYPLFGTQNPLITSYGNFDSSFNAPVTISNKIPINLPPYQSYTSGPPIYNLWVVDTVVVNLITNNYNGGICGGNNNSNYNEVLSATYTTNTITFIGPQPGFNSSPIPPTAPTLINPIANSVHFNYFSDISGSIYTSSSSPNQLFIKDISSINQDFNVVGSYITGNGASWLISNNNLVLINSQSYNSTTKILTLNVGKDYLAAGTLLTDVSNNVANNDYLFFIFVNTYQFLPTGTTIQSYNTITHTMSLSNNIIVPQPFIVQTRPAIIWSMSELYLEVTLPALQCNFNNCQLLTNGGGDININGTSQGNKIGGICGGSNRTNISFNECEMIGNNINISGTDITQSPNSNNYNGGICGGDNSGNLSFTNCQLLTNGGGDINISGNSIYNNNSGICSGRNISNMNFNECEIIGNNINIIGTNITAGSNNYNGGICGGDNSGNLLTFEDCRVIANTNIDVSGNFYTLYNGGICGGHNDISGSNLSFTNCEVLTKTGDIHIRGITMANSFNGGMCGGRNVNHLNNMQTNFNNCRIISNQNISLGGNVSNESNYNGGICGGDNNIINFSNCQTVSQNGSIYFNPTNATYNNIGGICGGNNGASYATSNSTFMNCQVIADLQIDISGNAAGKNNNGGICGGANENTKIEFTNCQVNSLTDNIYIRGIGSQSNFNGGICGGQNSNQASVDMTFTNCNLFTDELSDIIIEYNNTTKFNGGICGGGNLLSPSTSIFNATFNN